MSKQHKQPDALTEYLQTHDLFKDLTDKTPQSPSKRKEDLSTKERLEQDLRTAAEVGQALLQRHRGTVKENKKLKMQIDELNQRLEELTRNNMHLVESNDELLRTQSEVNGALKESTIRLDNANDELIDARSKIKTLSQYCSQAKVMADQVEYLESVREQLTSELEVSREAKRLSDIQRYKMQRDLELLRRQFEELELQLDNTHSYHELSSDESTLPTSPEVSFSECPTSSPKLESHCDSFEQSNESRRLLFGMSSTHISEPSSASYNITVVNSSAPSGFEKTSKSLLQSLI